MKKMLNSLSKLIHTMKANEQVKTNTTLVVDFKNVQPVELVELTKSLCALNNQFKSFSHKEGCTTEQTEAKLYVSKIVKGSIIVELVEYASVALLPIIVEQPDLVISFSKYIKEVFEYFIHGKGEKPELSVSDLKDIASLVSPTSKDDGATLSISARDNATNNFYNCVIVNSLESNAMQNKTKREISERSLIENNDGVFEKEIMVFKQTRKGDDDKKGTKAKIDNLNDNYLNVVFESGLKDIMLESSGVNPLKTAYVVDVSIQTVQNKPFAYRVLKLHEMIDIDE